MASIAMTLGEEPTGSVEQSEIRPARSPWFGRIQSGTRSMYA